MSTQGSPGSECKPKPSVESITEVTASVTLTLTRGIITESTVSRMTESNNGRIRISSGRVTVSISAMYAREISAVFMREYLANGHNQDKQIPEALAYYGDMHDIDVIFNQGVQSLIIQDQQHAARLFGLARHFSMPILVVRLNVELSVSNRHYA
ncbi:hypothetical protein HDE_04597 [Halotydeus destructor]|nr:hypothetical protein HDE_04597 [Halotydeus destructor]